MSSPCIFPARSRRRRKRWFHSRLSLVDFARLHDSTGAMMDRRERRRRRRRTRRRRRKVYSSLTQEEKEEEEERDKRGRESLLRERERERERALSLESMSITETAGGRFM